MWIRVDTYTASCGRGRASVGFERHDYRCSASGYVRRTMVWWSYNEALESFCFFLIAGPLGVCGCGCRFSLFFCFVFSPWLLLLLLLLAGLPAVVSD